METLRYAAAVLKLLKGVVYEEEKEIWNIIIEDREALKDYFHKIGLKVLIFESDGYAFLSQDEPEEGSLFPLLVERRQLSYPVTLLLALLRNRFAEMEANSTDARLVLNKKEIKEMLVSFLPEDRNEAKRFDKIDVHINKLIDYGFLRKLKNESDRYEVKNIIKAKINADILSEILQKLEEHARNLGTD
ncbi:MAG: DUF4194 domain-containing protein [Leptospiraceae bacterium]|nr:DUF4194 domain-containing protein [Leptospiraceae bacterium]